MRPLIPSGKILSVTLCASFAIKTYDYGQHFCFYLKTKRKIAHKTLKRGFLKEFKATFKTSNTIEFLASLLTKGKSETSGAVNISCKIYVKKQ